MLHYNVAFIITYMKSTSTEISCSITRLNPLINEEFLACMNVRTQLIITWLSCGNWEHRVQILMVKPGPEVRISTSGSKFLNYPSLISLQYGAGAHVKSVVKCDMLWTTFACEWRSYSIGTGRREAFTYPSVFITSNPICRWLMAIWGLCIMPKDTSAHRQHVSKLLLVF